MGLWDAWFNPNSFYSYCAVVPVISGVIAYNNLACGKPPKSMIFPAAFLLFMFPLPAAWTDPLCHQLKFFSAGLSAGVLNLLQIPSALHGAVILMPHGAVVVNDACSGIRAVICLLAMGCVFAYYMDSSWERKFWLMAAVVPLALMTNALRIVFLAVVTEFWGAGYTKGLIHNIAGLLIYGLSFLVLLQLSTRLAAKTS